jgi:hypothetical protein
MLRITSFTPEPDRITFATMGEKTLQTEAMLLYFVMLMAKDLGSRVGIDVPDDFEYHVATGIAKTLDPKEPIFYRIEVYHIHEQEYGIEFGYAPAVPSAGGGQASLYTDGSDPATISHSLIQGNGSRQIEDGH